MTIDGTNIYMVRGDSESITVTVEGYQLQAGDIAELTVRRSARSSKVLHKTASPNLESNSFTISIDPEDTKDLQFGKYVYDVQLTLNGAVKTVVKLTTFTIGEEVTYD